MQATEGPIDVGIVMEPIARVIWLHVEQGGHELEAEIDEKVAAKLAHHIGSGRRTSLRFTDTFTGREVVLPLTGSTDFAKNLREAALALRHEKDEHARLEVWRALREHDHKYAYYKLTAAGAALAFALTKTQSALLTRSQIVLGLAALCWGMSIASGFAHLGNVRKVLLEEAAGRDLKSASEAVTAGNVQLVYFVAGAVLYILWHFLEMYLRTKG